MLMNIIMAICMYPIYLLMYFVIKNNGKLKNGRYFSVNFKEEWLQEEATKQKIADTEKRFQKELKMVLLTSFLATLPCYVISYVSIQITIWLVALYLAVGIFYLPFVRANKALKAWKEEQGYSSAQIAPEIYVELKNLGQVRRVKWSQYAAPIGITVATVLSPIFYRRAGNVTSATEMNETVFYIFWITFLLSILLFAVCAIAQDKKNVDVISRDSDINLNYTRAKKNIWKQFWQMVTWLTVLLQVVLAVVLWSEKLFWRVTLWGVIVHSLIVLAVCVVIAKKISRVDNAYKDKVDATLFVDDDKYWLGGIIYYNPRDNRSLVETRIGMGTTTNMARPLGVILDAVAVVAILFSVGMCVWIVMEEFTPISLQVAAVTEEQSIQAYHLSLEYEIDLNEITDITALTELPKMRKNNGSAMDTLYKGRFYVPEDLTQCAVFLNPENEIFLRIETEEKIYYMSGVNDAETQNVYESILEYRE